LDNYKTIKELADELEYSKQTIQKIIEGFSSENKPKKKGNRYILSLDNQNQIKQILGIDISNNETNILDNDFNKTDIEDTFSDIETDKSNKNEYIAYLLSESDIKNKRIETLEKLLDQQQQLTLQSNKQIDQLQKQLLLLSKPAESDLEEDVKEEKEEFGESKNAEIEKSKIESEKEKTEKKWFQFWK